MCPDIMKDITQTWIEKVTKWCEFHAWRFLREDNFEYCDPTLTWTHMRIIKLVFEELSLSYFDEVPEQHIALIGDCVKREIPPLFEEAKEKALAIVHDTFYSTYASATPIPIQTKEQTYKIVAQQMNWDRFPMGGDMQNEVTEKWRGLVFEIAEALICRCVKKACNPTPLDCKGYVLQRLGWKVFEDDVLEEQVLDCAKSKISERFHSELKAEASEQKKTREHLICAAVGRVVPKLKADWTTVPAGDYPEDVTISFFDSVCALIAVDLAMTESEWGRMVLLLNRAEKHHVMRCLKDQFPQAHSWILQSGRAINRSS